jgi:hypothetical protein
VLRVLLLSLLSGCNLVFPLAPEPLPPTDGPTGSVVCPAAGIPPKNAPELSTRAPTCAEYTEDLAGRGLASCEDSPAEIPPDDTSFTTISNLVSNPQRRFQQPRLAPEGEQLFMVVLEDLTGYTLQTSLKSGTRWEDPSLMMSTADPALLVGLVGVGSPTTGPTRHMMINVGGDFHEVVVEGLEVTAVQSYTSKDLGFTFLQHAPNLTSDGRRAVVEGVDELGDLQVYYLERASIDVRFETGVALDSAPISNDIFMTSNCARLYAGSVGQVLFARQL